MEDTPMKRTETIHTTVGDLIVSLTDETLKYIPEPRRAYGIVASMLAGLPLRQAKPISAGTTPRRRAILSAANAIVLFVCLAATLGLTACTSSFEPRMSAGGLEAPRLPTAREARGGVEVSIEEYYSSHKSRRAFDADVGSRGILPILIHIENRSPQDYRIERRNINAKLNGQSLPVTYGIDAAEIGALRNPTWNALVNTAALGPMAMFFGVGVIAGSASQTQKINRQVEQHFERMELTDRIVKPNETAAGFVFFRLPSGAKSLDTLNLEMILAAEPFEGHPVRPLIYQFAVPTH
jgi:hypothetical protein